MLKSKPLAVIIFWLCCCLIAGCNHKGEQATPSPNGSSEDPEADLIRAQINQMTLGEKIGQMVLVGVEGLTLGDHAKDLIEQYHVGGIIFYKENIENAVQALTFVNELKSANANNKLPLFISVDQEGGRVNRMPDEFAKLPSNQIIGKVNDASFSYAVGAVLGMEIKALGFNMDFAPVLDINSNPQNPIIGDRSFGSNATIVSKLGVQTMRGLQSVNVISVVKHFPGHGDTSVDSHLDLPVVNHSLSRLKQLEWIPFTEAINNQADTVMIAHILLPQIDASHPASFSKTIVTDYLRNELHFAGVVITDDMTMGGIVKNYDLQDASVKSILAGCDIILVAHDYNKAVEVITTMRRNVENGVIAAEAINQSVYRIMRLKQKYGLTNQKSQPADVAVINHHIHDVLALGKIGKG
jgi:beta-N-acetylhexosaminidase